MLPWFGRHPILMSAGAVAIAAGVVLAIGEVAGLHQVGHAFDDLHPAWVIVAVATGGVSVSAYVVAYRGIVVHSTGARLKRHLSIELVLAGFGPLAVAGGFFIDRRAMERLGIDERRALRMVLDLGGLEFLSLVWIAFVFAVAALVADPSLPGGLIWPWIVAVPVGTAIAVWLAHVERPERVSSAHVFLREVAGGLQDVMGFARHPWRARESWLGIVLFWIADMTTLYVSLRAFGLRPPWQSLGLAYATGYLFSRRTLPFNGAGIVEVLMTFSLYWTHQPLAPSLAGVVLYRAVTFALAALPALGARFRFLVMEDLEHPFDD